MLSRLSVFVAAFVVGSRTPFWITACGGVLLWTLRNFVVKALEQAEGRSKMHFVAEHQLTATQRELEAMRNACDSTSARLVYAHQQISILEQQLRAALLRASTAETDLKVAGCAGARVQTEQERLYGRLGLTPNVPGAFLPHIRRAVVMTLHPDRHPAERKVAAEKRFVEAMAVLERIERDRYR